jgi:transcriptional regulator with XRE-family HTH domain
MTQLELAKASGVSRVTVARLETGYPATATTVRKLSWALGVRPTELTAQEDGEPKALEAVAI